MHHVDLGVSDFIMKYVGWLWFYEQRSMLIVLVLWM